MKVGMTRGSAATWTAGRRRRPAKSATAGALARSKGWKVVDNPYEDVHSGG